MSKYSAIEQLGALQRQIRSITGEDRFGAIHELGSLQRQIRSITGEARFDALGGIAGKENPFGAGAFDHADLIRRLTKGLDFSADSARVAMPGAGIADAFGTLDTSKLLGFAAGDEPWSIAGLTKALRPDAADWIASRQLSDVLGGASALLSANEGLLGSLGVGALNDHIGPIFGLIRALDVAHALGRAGDSDDGDEDDDREPIVFGDLEHHGSLLLADSLDLADLDGLSLPEAQRRACESTKWVSFQVVQRVLADPRALREIDERDFESLVAEILDRLGFTDVKLTPRSGDGGVDVIATQVVAGFPIVMYFQCKRYAEHRRVTLDAIRALLGVTLNDKVNKGVMVTTTRFTAGERELIASTAMLDGRDYDAVQIRNDNEFERFGVNSRSHNLRYVNFCDFS